MKKLLLLPLLISFSVQALTVGCPDLSKTSAEEIKAKYNLEVEFLDEVRVIERTGFQPIHKKVITQRDEHIWGKRLEEVVAVTDNTPLKRISSRTIFEVEEIGIVKFDKFNPDHYSGIVLAFKSKEVKGLFIKAGSLLTASLSPEAVKTAERVTGVKKNKTYPLSVLNKIDSLMLECKEKELETTH